MPGEPLHSVGRDDQKLAILFAVHMAV
jgi:hypothetical protein